MTATSSDLYREDLEITAFHAERERNAPPNVILDQD